ncbi:hypothetical protein ACFLRO_01560 [Bacteroidota bacterium]
MNRSILLLVGGVLVVSAVSLFAFRSSSSEPSSVFKMARSANSTATGVFIPNLGHAPREAFFYLNRDEDVVLLRASNIDFDMSDQENSRYRAGLRFISSNGSPKLVGLEPLSQATGFRAVDYLGLYEGVDLRLAIKTGKLSGRFTLAPGVDPDMVLFKTDDLKGGLIGKPFAYHDVNGHKIPLLVSFEPARYGSTRLDLGPHDIRLPVEVDFEIRF